jgi:hypothetical protein
MTKYLTKLLRIREATLEAHIDAIQETLTEVENPEYALKSIERSVKELKVIKRHKKLVKQIKA